MGFDYNPEEAIQKIPAAIEAGEELVGPIATKTKDILADTAKTVNAATLTKICDMMSEAVDSTMALVRSVLGEDGDTMSNGTVYGALKGAKDMDAALNGGN